jgi:hypothetical protein
MEGIINVTSKPAAIALFSSVLCFLLMKILQNNDKKLNDIQYFLVNFGIVFISGILVCWGWDKFGLDYATNSIRNRITSL